MPDLADEGDSRPTYADLARDLAVTAATVTNHLAAIGVVAGPYALPQPASIARSSPLTDRRDKTFCPQLVWGPETL